MAPNDAPSKLAPPRYLDTVADEEKGAGVGECAPPGMKQGAPSSTGVRKPKVRYTSDDTKSPLSFLSIVFVGRSKMGFLWFVSKVLPQLILGIALILLVEYVRVGKGGGWLSKQPDGVQKVHGYLAALVAFVLSLRSNGAYDRYYESRKTLGTIVNQAREIVLETHSLLTKPGEDHLRAANELREKIARKVHIMLAFIRQSVRESHVGFNPHSSEAKTDFHAGNNFVRDPTRPLLRELMTPAEVTAYAELPVQVRAACMASEIKGDAQRLSKHLVVESSVYNKVSSCLEKCLDGEETLYRIITTPLPFPYNWILHAMLLLFVYSVPFIYEFDRSTSYLSMVLVIFIYFGVIRIAEQCENPLEWDFCDLDCEAIINRFYKASSKIEEFAQLRSNSKEQ